MSRFRVGLMDSVMAGRPSVDTYSRASYLAAVANRVDSYWVPDHINGQTPRPLWDPKYTGGGTSAAVARRGDGGVDPARQPGGAQAIQPGPSRRRRHRHR